MNTTHPHHSITRHLFSRTGKLALFGLLCLTAIGLFVVLAADQFFAGDGSALTAAKWGTTAGGPFTSAFTSGNVANFATVNGTGTGGSITVGGITATENFTITAISGTIGNQGNAVIPINVSSGKTLDFSTQSFTTSATAGYNFTGPGVLAMSGNTYGGGFTINSGTLVARGVNAMGGNATPGGLTINGGTIAGSATRDFSNKYSGITVGGNFQLGELVTNVASSSSTANLTFNTNMALGAATRTITIGANGTYILGGIISGNSGVGLTVANGVGATGKLTLSGANTYNGNTTINGGILALSGSGSIATSPTIEIAGGATFDVTGLTTALTLASNQALKASGTATTGTITTSATKGLTTAANSPLQFTAFNGATAPLTIAGAGSVTLASGNVVTVTVANGGNPLGAGDYTLIAKGASGSVVGSAPTSLTVNGDGIAGGTTASLQITGQQLVLHIAAAPPTITAGGPLSRQQGTAASNSQIATVSDANAGTLTVTATTVPAGITVNTIVNSSGTVTANVAALCNATVGMNTVVLTVTNATTGLTNTANLTVNVTANTPPALGTYPSAGTISTGTGTTVTPSAPPSDNGTINSITASAPGFTGSFSVNPTTGVVTISNAGPVGNYTVTVTATDNCNAITDATFTLNVTAAVCTAPPPNLLSWWPGELNANDITAGNNGTLMGSATFAPGEVGQAFSFNGTTAFVQAPTTGLPTGNSDRTLELWVKINSFPAQEAFFAGYGSFGNASQTYQLGANASDNKLFFSQWNDGITGPVLQTGVWYHVAVTNVGNSIKLYLNGSQVASGANTLNTPSGAPLYLGRIAGTLGDIRRLDGLVDEVRVYSRALSATEIAGIYNAGTAGVCISPPTISTTTVTRQQGSPAGSAVNIATVSDAEDMAGNLSVAVIAGGTATGITLGPLTNTSGTISATVAASCTATAGTVRLQVTDSTGLTASGDLQVNVNANTPPTLTYNNASTLTGTATTVSPATGPSDNGNVATIVVQSVSPSPAPGTITVDNSTGVVSVPNNVPPGMYTVTIRATDNCGLPNGVTDASFTLTVNCPAITLGTYPTASVTAGDSITVTPNAAPSSNLSITAAAAGSMQSPFTGVLTVNPTTGVVTITDAKPAGTYTVTVTARDICGVSSTKTFTLTVNNPATCAPASFGFRQPTGSPIGVGGNPYSVAVGDFNGDGKQDLAVTQGNNVVILLGAGSGSFSPASGSPVTAGNFPFFVAVGDFNGDGKQDLAVANLNSNDVTILLGNGSGGFSQPIGSPFGVGTTPTSVAAGDFNGDGKQDLAVSNEGSNNVTILLGNGTGSFSASTVSVGSGAESVVVGNFNGDGNQDLAVANFFSNDVTILLGNGSGGFSQPIGSPFGAGNHPRSMAAGDFNGDGQQDLAVANRDSNDVTILLGNGSGSFSAASGSPFAVEQRPTSVEVGDFNGDGKQDLAVGNRDSSNVSILLGNGSGSFSPAAASPFGVGSGPRLAVGDFNGDGKQDFAAANSNDGTLTIMLNNCAPTIAAGTVTRQQGSPSGAAVNIATVSDAEDMAGTLSVAVIAGGTATGITLGPLTNTSGTISAAVAASCTATAGTVRLQVTDSAGLMATSDLQVNVNANTPPTLTYNNASTLTGNATTVNPATGPSDNGNVATIIVQNVTPSTAPGTITVDNLTGVVTVPNNVPTGTYTVTIRATDQCGAPNGITDAVFTLTVGCVNALTVNNTGDGADATPGNGVCETLTGNGICTLRAALQEANALPGCSPFVITTSATGTINVATSLPDLTHPNLTINGPGANMLDVHRSGAGNYRLFTVNSATAAISGLTISNGNVVGVDGGGVEVAGHLTLTACTLSGNQTDGEGGAVYVTASGMLDMTGCTLSGNTAATGGGLSSGTSNSIIFNLTNSTISGNTATVAGGGIGLNDPNVTMNLLNVTIANNTATTSGGGIAQIAGTVNFKNTLIAGNSAPSGPDISGSVFSLDFNLIGNTAGATIGGTTTNNVTGVAALLAPLSNYGGPTQTRALLPGSPAINAGTNAGAPATDQRGIMRPKQTTTDIGAFESQGFTLAIASGSGQSAFVNTNFASPLSATVSSSFSEPVNGGQVTFTPPGAGASASLAGNPATISGGTATSGAVTANSMVGGPYNVAASATGATAINFALTNTNPPPMITAGAALSRQQGTAASNSPIATVSDPNQTAGTLTVTATTLPTGITVMNIVNTAGAITADVAAGCNATVGTNTVVLTVTDSFSATATANLTVNVTANTPPTLTYANASVAAGAATNVSPLTASDNGTITGYSIVSVVPPLNVAPTVNSSGVVAITNAGPSGNHVITVQATDNCTATTNAMFTLTVNCPAITVNPPSLPNGTVGTAYSQTITPSGGSSANYTYSSTGTLPPGLLLSPGPAATATLSGTPTTATGSPFSFTIIATDANGCTGSQSYSVSINTRPAISALGVTRTAGSPTANSPIATVSDADQSAGSLTVTINTPTVNNVTVSNIVNTNGTVTADIATPCNATTANFTLTVTDTPGATNTATLTVTVNANTPPSVSYSNASVAAGGSTTVSPNSATDNGSINGYSIFSVVPPLTTPPTVNASGVVSITNAQPPGNHTITVQATDNCGAPSGVANTSFTLAVGLTCPSTLTVNDLGDTPDASAGDGTCNDGTGKCTLRAAIQEANAITACSPLTINFSVTGTINLATALPDLNHPNLTISNASGPSQLTVRRSTAGGTPDFRIFTIPPAKTVAINGLTLTNGRTNGEGGGIRSYGNLTLSNAVITGNSAVQGGGVMNKTEGATVTSVITNCAISGNSSSNGGSGVMNQSQIGTLNLTIIGTTISGNTDGETLGDTTGALSSFSDQNGKANLVVNNSTISGNSSVSGGAGVSNFSFNGMASATFTNTTIANNTATGVNASGFMTGLPYANTTTTTTFRNTILANNSPNNLLLLNGNSSNNTVVSQGNNLASDNGSGLLTGSGDLINTNPLLAPLGNYGGPTPTRALLPGSPAINAGGPATTAEIQTVTVSGGAGTFTLTFNGPTTSPALAFNATAAQMEAALIALSTIGGAGGSVMVSRTGAGAGPFVYTVTFGGSLAGANQPQMTATGAGGATVTISTLVDGGTLTTDQRGVARPQLGLFDIGAFESQGFALAIAGGNNQTTPINSPFGLPLLVGVTPVGAGEPVNGGQITFTPPGSGASATVAGNPATISSSMALSGTVTANDTTGAYQVSAAAKGASPVSFNLTNTCAALAINPATLPSGQFGVLYNQTLTASGGKAPYAFTLQNGSSLPAGLMLSLGGVISGTPTAPGATTFTVLVMDANGCGGNRTFTVGIQCPTIGVNPAPSLPNPQAGVAYSQTLTGSGGVGPYTFALHAGSSLPPGLNLAGGVISGTPTTLGTTTFTIDVTDTGLPIGPNFCGGNRTYTVTVGCPTITLSPSLPNGVQGTAYSQTLTAAPAGGNYSFALASGTLPPGLTLNSNGTLNGTPSAAGNFAFVLKATGWGGTCMGAQSYNLLITGTCGPITLSPAALPGGTLGTAYSQIVSATGGTGPYTFAVASGALPAGLTLNATTGVLGGTPAGSGSFAFTVKATDAGGCFGTRTYFLIITCATLTFNPPILPNGTKGVAYSQTLSVSPAGSYTFSLLVGQLPIGFTLSSTGVISGLTNTPGSYTFTVKVLAGNCQSTKTYTLVIVTPSAAMAHMGDYDGDGKADLALWSNNGAWRLSLSSGGANRETQTQSWGATGDVALLGDYDGDGNTDLAVFRPSDGTWRILKSGRSSDGGTLVKAWGLATDVPVPGDYDGDGKTDIAVWRGSEGNWYIVRSSDGAVDSVAWGAAYAPYNDVPVPGDYDGDGKTDVAVFRRSTGTWLIKRSSDGQFMAKAWGLGTDVPVAADYDGDGKTDFAVWRGDTWYIWQSKTQSVRAEQWGANYAPYFDQAVPGDYDGDGKADVAVWRAADQTWYIRCSADGSVLAQAQGQAGDAPVSARRQ